METATTLPEPIYSTFGCDPEMLDLVEMFVEEMPLRVANLRTAFAMQEADTLKRIAHQLKGAAGSYGFDTITPYAAALERAACADESAERIGQLLDDLTRVCQRIRSGESKNMN